MQITDKQKTNMQIMSKKQKNKQGRQMTDKQKNIKKNLWIMTDNQKKQGMQMTEKQRNKKEHIDNDGLKEE